MLKELQKLIEDWKQEAAGLEKWNEREYDDCLHFQNKGRIERLRKSISEVELLLSEVQPNSEIASPLQQAAVMRGEARTVGFDTDDSIDTVGHCANCGVEFHIHKANGA